MNSWSAEQIRSLRLRLGWSAADFSRRFGCSSELILNWESGENRPNPEDLIQFQQLEFYLNSYSEQVARSPEAERVLQELKYEQVHLEDVKNQILRS